VIVIASVHGLVASPFKAAYVSAKHGVLGLVKTLALEGAEVGITATAVCPGYVRTPLVQKQIADQARAHSLSEDQVLEQVILAPHAVKELIEPEEVAEVVTFLAGPAGRAFTGAPVTMDQAGAPASGSAPRYGRAWSAGAPPPSALASARPEPRGP